MVAEPRQSDAGQDDLQDREDQTQDRVKRTEIRGTRDSSTFLLVTAGMTAEMKMPIPKYHMNFRQWCDNSLTYISQARSRRGEEDRFSSYQRPKDYWPGYGPPGRTTRATGFSPPEANMVEQREYDHGRSNVRPMSFFPPKANLVSQREYDRGRSNVRPMSFFPRESYSSEVRPPFEDRERDHHHHGHRHHRSRR